MRLHDSAAANTGLYPLQNLFRVQFLDSVELQSELLLKTQPLLLAQELVSRWLELAGGTWRAVVTHPRTPPPALLSKAEAGPSLPHAPCPSRQSPPAALVGWAAHDAALCTLGWVCRVNY